MSVVHFEGEILFETTFRSACGVYSDKHTYTQRDEEVTCPKCLKALGYEAVPETQLTQCVSDPLLKKAA